MRALEALGIHTTVENKRDDSRSDGTLPIQVASRSADADSEVPIGSGGSEEAAELQHASAPPTRDVRGKEGA